MITPKKLLKSLYTLDATAQEILWVLGPLLATVVAAQFGNLVMLYTLALIQITGTTWFLLNKSVAASKIPKSEGQVGKVLKNPAVTSVTLLGLLFVGSFAGIEVGAVAIFDKTIAGAMIATFSVGSFIGGFWLGPKIKGKYALTAYLGIVLLGYSMVFVAPQNPFWMAFSLLVAGLGVAPALGYLSLVIAQGTKPSETAEAYGWTTTGQLVGFSAGSALAGIAIDTINPTAALLVSITFGLATLLASLAVEQKAS
jgi:predicted MFS family arabinose efflux permease